MRCGSPGVNPNACAPNLSQLKFIDSRLDLTNLLGGANDLRQVSSFKNVSLPSSLPSLQTQGTKGSSTSQFTSGVTKPGKIYFKLLEPETIFKLILGQPADIVIAVRVGDVPAPLQNNAFAAVIPRGASDVVTVSTPPSGSGISSRAVVV